MNIIGRAAQYIGHVYAMAAVWAAIKEAKSMELTTNEAIESFFGDAEANYQALAETVPLAIVLTDFRDRILIWNEGAERLFGISKNQVIGKKLNETIIFSEKPILNKEYNDRDYGEFITEVSNISKAIVPVEVFFSVRKSLNGCIITYIFKDVTEKKLYESELTRLSSLDIIGQMAASIAHEVRNPLTTVRGFLQYYNKKTENKEYSNFALMIDELDRANSIITEYLSLARNKDQHLEAKNLALIVIELCPLMEAYALEQGKNLFADVNTDTTPVVMVDEQEIKQLISNLVRNSLEALQCQGIVKIIVTTEKQHVILSVQDNGSGIPLEVLSKIGTPFFTTKSNGTGLGLSVCYRIASRHNAIIDVDSSDSGTTVNVCFSIPS